MPHTLMAMRSGVLRVPLLSSLLLLAACTGSVSNETVFVPVGSPRLRQAPGVLHCDGAPFSGVLFALYNSRDTAELISYLNGREHGEKKSWYPNGRLKEIRQYVHGQKHGLHQGWWPDGKPAFVYHIQQGAYHGNVKEWLENGRLVKDFNYVHGQEQGHQRMWYADGTLQANYEVHNGRKFGLTGTKSCVNVWDETEH